jgi:hypothetical protein
MDDDAWARIMSAAEKERLINEELQRAREVRAARAARGDIFDIDPDAKPWTPSAYWTCNHLGCRPPEWHLVEGRMIPRCPRCHRFPRSRVVLNRHDYEGPRLEGSDRLNCGRVGCVSPPEWILAEGRMFPICRRCGMTPLPKPMAPIEEIDREARVELPSPFSVDMHRLSSSGSSDP